MGGISLLVRLAKLGRVRVWLNRIKVGKHGILVILGKVSACTGQVWLNWPEYECWPSWAKVGMPGKVDRTSMLVKISLLVRLGQMDRVRVLAKPGRMG